MLYKDCAPGMFCSLANIAGLNKIGDPVILYLVFHILSMF